MAIATTTALAIAGLAATAGTTGMSFANAGKQSRLAKEAKASADAAMAQARKALEVNFQEQRAINKQPYELEREALLSSAAQAIDAGVESGQAAPTAGRIQLAMNNAQAGVTSRMGEEMSEIDKAIINEQGRLRDLGVQIDLGEAEGAKLAERDAREAQALATQQGMQGIASAVGQVAAMPSLFGSQDVVETVTAEGFKPADTVRYQAPLPIASPSPYNTSNPLQVSGATPQIPIQAQPIYPYGIPKPSPNPFMSVGGTSKLYGY